MKPNPHGVTPWKRENLNWGIGSNILKKKVLSVLNSERFDCGYLKVLVYSNFLQASNSSKNMDLIFCKLKTLKKHEFNVLQALKSSKKMDLMFASLKKSQGCTIPFIAFSTSSRNIDWFLIWDFSLNPRIQLPLIGWLFAFPFSAHI